MNRQWLTAVIAVVASGMATPVAAQWNGFYLGGFGGLMLQNGDHDETVTFDTDLDEEFGDTVRTITGADVFAPGFCPGAATGLTPASECEDDESGFALGGRAGYDEYFGGVILGVVGDLSFPEATDSVSAFSTPPAFYTFTRDLQWMAGLRGRIGAGNDHVLAYATGGLALGRIEHVFATSNVVNTFVPIGSDDDDDRRGGGGRAPTATTRGATRSAAASSCGSPTTWRSQRSTCSPRSTTATTASSGRRDRRRPATRSSGTTPGAPTCAEAITSWSTRSPWAWSTGSERGQRRGQNPTIRFTRALRGGTGWKWKSSTPPPGSPGSREV